MSTDRTPRREDRFSFGIWTVGWQGVDVFGGAVRPPMPADRAVRKLAELGAYGVNFHDNDVFDFDATPGRAGRSGSARFRKALDETGLVVTTATTNLFVHPMFKDGAFTANERDVRRFALAKVMRNLDLAAELGARIYVFWGGREGAESGAGQGHPGRARPVRRGPGPALRSTSCEQGYGIRFAIEPKPNEPRGDILLPTAGHALAFINELEHPEHGGGQPGGRPRGDGRAQLRARRSAQALWHGKLFHIDLNGQHGPRYDQDLRFGAGNARGAFWVVDALEAGGYDGPVHFDYKPPRTEDDDGRVGLGGRVHAQLPDPAGEGPGVPRRPRGQGGAGAPRGSIELGEPTLADGETWRDVRDATADVDGAGRRAAWPSSSWTSSPSSTCTGCVPSPRK